MLKKYEDEAKIFHALSDPKRLAIIEMLQDGEKCACKLLETISIAQPALSYHMRILCESGIVVSRQEGKWMYYHIDRAGSQKAIEVLKTITLCNQ